MDYKLTFLTNGIDGPSLLCLTKQDLKVSPPGLCFVCAPPEWGGRGGGWLALEEGEVLCRLEVLAGKTRLSEGAAYGRGSLPRHNLVSDSANPHYVSDPLQPMWDHRSIGQL